MTDIQYIENVACRIFGVDRERLHSGARISFEETLTRHVVMKVAYDLLPITHKTAGDYFGLSHAASIHAKSRVAGEMDIYAEFAARVNEVEEDVTAAIQSDRREAKPTRRRRRISARIPRRHIPRASEPSAFEVAYNEYDARKRRRRRPGGTYTGHRGADLFWQPTAEERQTCCEGVMHIYSHCKTAIHVAHLFGIDPDLFSAYCNSRRREETIALRRNPAAVLAASS